MRTVRVRIAVAVDAEGDWVASGWRRIMQYTPVESVSARIGTGKPMHIVWVEADVPIPVEVTVEGRVGE